MTPSDPMPKLRSHMKAICSGVNPGSPFVPSKTMKSFPMPWYFQNCVIW